MTLRMEAVAGQLAPVITAYREGLASMEAGIQEARAALGQWAADAGVGDMAIRAAMADSARPYALSFGEPPGLSLPAPPFSPATVVAADGSSIEPDRFGPVQCFVVNIGVAVLPYGVTGDAVLESKPMVGPQASFSDEGEDRGRDETAPSGWGVSLQRDARELFTGATLAQERTAHGPVVLLVDGTLLPWDLDSPQVAPAVRQQAESITREALALIQNCGQPLSVGAYISGSRSSDVVVSLGALHQGGAGHWPPCDAVLFARLLAEGHRSAIFRSCSQRLVRIEERLKQEVCFFYLRIGDDLARVELPGWAASPAQVGRLHATIVDQCSRAGGYPRALQEAHEQAVISGADRLQFSRLLENESARHGLRAMAGGKQMSKRRRAV